MNKTQLKKTIVIGVSGGIAAYKTVQLVSDLIKLDYDVEVIMTKNATNFIQPLTFESLCKHRVHVDTFDARFEYSTEHISLAKKADVFLIAPATANVIAKIAHGIADDMLTTTFLAATCPKLIAPAMNTNMYENSITQANFIILKQHGMSLIEPGEGLLACGDIGQGKLASIPELIERIEEALQTKKTLLGKKIVITAGPTIEAIDPVRYITNHSSGKMGIALAIAARNLGAQVVLIHGPVSVALPTGMKCIPTDSAKDMFAAIKQEYVDADFIIKAAAVSDYRVENVSDHKIKKEEDQMTLTFSKNPDILSYLGEHVTKYQVLCGFAMETEQLIENATKKLIKKRADMIVANDLKQEGAGFQGDTNLVVFVTKHGVLQKEMMSKQTLAYEILEELRSIQIQKQGE